MKDHPIIFSAEMVKAILEGRKTQTRRVLKKQPADILPMRGEFAGKLWVTLRERLPNPTDQHGDIIRCRYGEPGDRLWVRETWALSDCAFRYRADGEWDGEEIEMGANARWRPSIHMPRRASRLALEIVSVRVERVQAISEEDAIAEGMVDFEMVKERAGTIGGQGEYKAARLPIGQFAKLWDSINAKHGYGWDENPWVWVIEFKRLDDGTLSR